MTKTRKKLSLAYQIIYQALKKIETNPLSVLRQSIWNDNDVHKKEETHRMTKVNRAFAHFR
ncbi:hypothetical protein AMTRI_Chr03g142020 [Amborella trichopoda]